MQILWWLAPPVVATVIAMTWVSWLGREGRGRVDPEVAVRRLGEAITRPPRTRRGPATSPRQRTDQDRSTGVAVRAPSRAVPPPSAPDSPGATRRAS